MKVNLLMWNLVESLQRRRARIVVMKLPCGESAVLFDAALHVNHASGTEVGVTKLFFPGPDDLYRFACSFSLASGRYRCLSGMFPSVTGACVRNDHPDI